MKRALKLLIYGIVIVMLVFASTVTIHRFMPQQPVGEIRYIDLIAIVLTALSIMITSLGLFVAALGVIGWTTFESKLRDNSLNYLTTELSKNGKLRKEFEEILIEISLRGVRPDDSTGTSRKTNDFVEERPYDD